MREDDAAQPQSGDAIGRSSPQSGQKRPHAPPKPRGISRAQIDKGQTDDDAAIREDGLAAYYQLGERRVRVGISPSSKRCMYFVADKSRVRRIAPCGFIPEFRVIGMAMDYSLKPALKPQAAPAVEPAKRTDQSRRNPRTDRPIRYSARATEQRDRRSEPPIFLGRGLPMRHGRVQAGLR